MRGALWAGALLLAATPLFAGQDAGPETKPAAETHRAPAKPGFRDQEFDDPAEPFVPLQPRTAAEQGRVDALAWYTAGRVLEASGDQQGALKAYKKAIQHNPDAVAVYRALIPLAFSLNLTDDAVRWAERLVELDPSDFQLLRRLGLHQAGQGDLAGALKWLELAKKAYPDEKETALYVTLMRDLAVLYKAANRDADAADCYTLVFEALQAPEKYHLDFRTRAQLLADPPATYERMGQAFLDVKRTDLAAQAFQKAAESKKGGSGNLSYNLAQVFLQGDKPERALEELQKYFDEQRQSKGRAAYELLVEVLKKLGKSDELLPRLEGLAQKDPRNTTLQFFLADQYLAHKKFDQAEALYKTTLTASADVQGYAGLAAVYREQNKPAELIDSLAKGYTEAGELKGLAAEIKAIHSDEKLLDAVLTTGRKLSENDPPQLDFAAAYVLANIAAEGRKTPETISFYRLAGAIRKERNLLVLEELGRYLVEVMQYADAAKAFGEAANDPNVGEKRPDLLYLLAQAQELAGNTKEALAAIAAARQLIPDHPLLQFQEAWIYYHSHQFEESIKRYEQLIAAFPQPQFKPLIRRAQFSLSNIYVLKGEQRKGEEILEEILKESPEDPSVNNDLGYLYADQGKNLEQAEKMIRKAVAAEPDNIAYLDSLGWVLFKQGKFADALPHLEKAVKNSIGGDETIWDHLGDLYDRLQKPAQALEAWKKALENARLATRPDHKLIDRLEEKIKTLQTAQGQLKPAPSPTP